jgi:hypothetical protein
MRAFRSVVRAGAVALLLAGVIVAPPTTKAADGANSVQVIKLLADARTMAVQARDDAATLEAFGQLDITWGAHAVSVARMREHVMAMNDEVTDLKAAEGTAEPWEKAVIDRIAPYITTLATDNEAIMDEFDLHPSLFGAPAANVYLEANVDFATHLSALVANLLENGTLRQMIQDYDQTEDSCSLIGVAHPAYGLES